MSGFATLDQTLRDTCASGQVAGLVAMAASGKKVLYSGAFGQRQPGGPAMALDDVFWIASMTKLATTIAALQLVEQGKLALDSPIGPLVPELAEAKVLEGFDADGNPQLRPAKIPVTLHHLLTHTAGLAYDMWNDRHKAWLAKTGTPGFGSGKLAALKVPLMSDPGAIWHYSTAIDYVGRAVEAASGQRLDHYFREKIFGPLGMDDTGFVLRPEQRPRVAAMHRRQPDGSLAQIAFEVGQSPEFFGGGGGLYGTAPDYIRLVQMILNKGRGNGTRIVQPESIAMMSHNQIGALDVQPMLTAVPAMSKDVEFWPGRVKKWSLGFLINTEAVPGGRSAGSLAWAGLSNCYYWIDPARDVAGVILMQTLPFFDQGCLAALGDFERAVYAHIPA